MGDLFEEADKRAAYARASDPVTSHLAARSVDTGRLESLVVAALKTYGPMTSIEISAVVNIGAWSISPRLKPLEEKGLVERTLERRKNNGKGKGLIVWQAKVVV